MYDSNDVLSVLYQQRKMNRSTWVPVFDGKIVASQKGRKERYWPIGILRDKLMCLVLKVCFAFGVSCLKRRVWLNIHRHVL